MIGYILAACVALALLRAVAAVLILGMIGAAVCALIFRPAETLTVACLLLIGSNPMAFVALGAVVLTACLIGKAIESRTKRST